MTKILAQGPHAGECEQCHTAHAEGFALPEPYALIGPDDNSLCDRCHTDPWSGGSYPGTWPYTSSSHGSSGVMIWPGPSPPPRTEAGAAAKCLNCHDPHGWQDSGGEIPGLRLAREESLCLACHDGGPAGTNIGADLQKTYRHPTSNVAGRHSGPGESQASDFAASPLNNRHAECEDCHNPHVAYPDPLGPRTAPDLSKVNLGTSRVRVLNGPAGVPPAYFFTPGADSVSVPVTEYQLCFKCHSSWTVQPTGQTDLALVLNPSNPSYHPVEAQGRNLNIRAGSFVLGWNAEQLTRCGDCHGSDFAGSPAGPHGSAYRYLLRQPYTASSSSRTMSPDELCFACHAWDVYANADASPSVKGYSRFNKPGAAKGHGEHVGEERAPCYACHVTHGSTTQPHLIATGRSPGLQTYAQSPTGGRCTPTCHEPESYTVLYAR